MEFRFYVQDALPIDEEGFAFLDASKLAKNQRYFSTLGNNMRLNNPITREEKLAHILDRMGEASSKVMRLILKKR